MQKYIFASFFVIMSILNIWRYRVEYASINSYTYKTKNMSLTEILSQKNDSRDILKTKYNLPKRSKVLVAIHFSEEKLTHKVLKWLSILPANFIVFTEAKEEIEAKNIAFVKDHTSFDMSGIDAILCDCDDIKLEKLMEVWVVPLVNERNYLWKILQEYHPGRAEGNAYLYEKWSHWSAYYALIRYLENHKFPYDNRNLVKNVVWV